MIEEWRKIPGYPLHEASNLGNVRSISRWVRRGDRPFWRPSRVLKPQKLQHADDKKPVAMTARISVFGDGINKNVYIHHLILLAFIGPRPEGMECCHWDGDPTNNAISNLRWDTPKANMEDKRRHGTNKGPTLCGEDAGGAKLTNAQILEIVDGPWGKRGIGNVYAKRFGVGNSAIYEVRRRYAARPDKLAKIRESLCLIKLGM